MKAALPLAALLPVLGGCATTQAQPPVVLKPAPTVQARVETDPVETVDDAADDPAIWRNAADPAQSLVIGTDKKAGLHVYGLDGKRRGFTPSPRLNNVDLRDGVTINGAPGVLVAASDRADIANARIALFRLDTTAAKAVPIGALPVGPGEAYGMCLWTRKADKALFGFVVMKDGRVDQVQIDASGPTPTGKLVRQVKFGTQSEGCVVDDRTGILYVAEEDLGLWKVGADPSAPNTPTTIARVDGDRLYDDVEGLALAPAGDKGGYLVASSQGDNAYVLYRLEDDAYVGRFRIADNAGVDGTSETDGLELALGDFGPAFPNGLLVVQDGDNFPSTQNFKYASWADVIALFGLK
ncbi:phytase [Sphingomonas sp. ID0503]|uniref:phytase n=1 Tax=Sphingomonas sp. ID0503 TaxID=3399691 RepID=UPI003AFADF1B